MRITAFTVGAFEKTYACVAICTYPDNQTHPLPYVVHNIAFLVRRVSGACLDDQLELGNERCRGSPDKTSSA